MSANAEPAPEATPLPRPERSRGPLRYAADRRMVGMVVAYFTLLAVEWNFAPLTPLVVIPLVVVTAGLAFLGAVATHNTLHCPVFKSRWMNNVWQVALTLTYGHPVCSYVPGHNLSHHHHTETRRDVMRTTKARFRWNLLNLAFFFLSVSGSIMRAEAGYTRYAFKRRPRWSRQLMVETAIYVAWIVGLLLLDWKRFLLFVQIPHWYAAWGIVTMNIFQHDGCDADSQYNHSRNFVGSVINWFTFNNGYHTVHHDRPGLHWSVAPEVHARLVSPHIHPALEQPSFIAYLWRAYFWPGLRLRYDGAPLVLPAEGPDEPWYGEAVTVTPRQGLEPEAA